MDQLNPLVPTPLTAGFFSRWNSDDSLNKRWAFLSRVFLLLFGEEFPKDRPIEQLRLKVAYRLMELEYAVADAKMPEKAAKNSKAAGSYDINGMALGMRQLTSIAVKQEEEVNMKLKKGNKKGEAKKSGVGHIYLEIFQNQATRKLTDEQIAEKVESVSGAKPTAKNIASYRCMYNAGKLGGQATMPKEKVKAFRAHKEKAKKPMDEATKAKLRAYAEKKKKAKK